MSRLKIYDLATGTWMYVGGIDPAYIALDTAFTSKYTQVINHGATAGTSRSGTAPCFWIGSVDPTNAINNDRLYRTDTTAYYVRVAGAWVESGSTRYSPLTAAWTPFTPVVKFGTTTATIVNDSRYLREGRKITAEWRFRTTAWGVGALTASRPVLGRATTLTYSYFEYLGGTTKFTAAGNGYAGFLTPNLGDMSDVTFRAFGTGAGAVGAPWSDTVPAAAVNTDEYYAKCVYEAAS